MKLDFHYCLNYDYDTDTDCEANNCGAICRCGIITNFKIRKIDADNFRMVVKEVCNSFEIEDKIEMYCVDRICRHFKLYESENYNANIYQGYYGQELHNIRLTGDLEEKLIKIIDSLKDNENPIQFVLELEYNFILPQLKDLKWEIKTLPVDLIEAGAKDQMRRADADSPYEGDIFSPIGVATYTGRRYRLWDGYHRYVAALKLKVDEVDVLVGI